MRLVVSSISFEMRSFSSSEVSGLFEDGFQFDYAVFVGGDEVGDLLFESLAASAQLIVRESFDSGVDGLDFLEVRFDLLTVFFRLWNRIRL